MKKLVVLFATLLVLALAVGCGGGSKQAADNQAQTNQGNQSQEQASQGNQNQEANKSTETKEQAAKTTETKEQAAKTTETKEQAAKTTDGSQTKTGTFSESQLKGKKVAIIETKYGKIYIELFPKEAPQTVKNFAKLAQAGFYNGLTFHRVESRFVVQGGDPKGTGSGGPGYTIPEELNSHQHIKGAVGMATQGTNTNTGGSQFYITLADVHQLDSGYTVFGQVLEGMNAVEQIQIGDKMNKVTVKDYK